jgi:NADH-quinone oxidoreductase subunit L
VPLIVFLPVAGLLINILFGERMSEKAIGALAASAVGLAFVVSVLQAVSLAADPHPVIVPLATWIHIGSLKLDWAFQVDTLSVVMMLVVSGVGTLIHIFAIGYMHDDVRFNGDPKRFRRFFVYFNLFIAAMMILVGGSSYMMLFVGWEGVGLCSFLLIGFWYEKGKDGVGNALAAKKAFITNRVGDFGFLLAAFTMFWAFGSFNFAEVFEKVPAVAQAQPWVITAITLFMFLGVTGKSAQLPLFVWLPDAMAGPTPVSALIHAATMVTAGVYLIVRSNVFYSAAPQVQTIVSTVGAVTAVFAGLIAVGQFDIKRVLAYSTISQLGFMVAAAGMGAYTAAIFHLATHAFFKALLFLGSGSVILGVEHGHHHIEHDPVLKKKVHGHGHDFDPQDMRNMGGLRSRMPTTFWVYLIGALALAGIFPLAGFWSKDEILVNGLEKQPLAFWLLAFAAILTAFYMGRQVLMVFFGEAHSLAAEHAKENPPVMTIPLMALAALSILGGALNLPKVETLGLWLEHTIEGLHPAEFNLLLAGGTTLLALLSILGSYWMYYRRYPSFLQIPAAKRALDPLAAYIGPVFSGMNRKFYVDELYQAVILNPYTALSKFLADTLETRFWHDWFHEVVIAKGYQLIASLLALKVDVGFIDAIANGLGRVTQAVSAQLRRLETGYVRNYALVFFLGVVAILAYLIFGYR